MNQNNKHPYIIIQAKKNSGHIPYYIRSHIETVNILYTLTSNNFSSKYRNFNKENLILSILQIFIFLYR